MRAAFATSIVGFSFLLQCSCLDYYRDHSCVEGTRGGIFTSAMDAAQAMAVKAGIRLRAIAAAESSNTEPDLYHKRIYEYLFKEKITDKATREAVLDVLDGVAAYRPSQNQKQSYIRFYCDGEKNNPSRYKLVGDLDKTLESRGPPPNSERTDYQEWDDVENGIREIGNIRECVRTKVPAFTTGWLGKSGWDSTLPESVYPGQKYPRVVTNLCDAFFEPDRGPNTLSEMMERELSPTAKNNGNIKLKDFKAVRAMTMFHEITHAPQSSAEDVEIYISGRKRKAYAWTPLGFLTKAQAIINTDTFTFYAALITLTDGGWGLDKDKVGMNLGFLKEYKEIMPPTRAPT